MKDIRNGGSKKTKTRFLNLTQIQMSVGVPFVLAALSKADQGPPLAGVQLWTTWPPYAEMGAHMRMPIRLW